MDGRDRWRALQAHLSRARTHLDAGDPTAALEAADAALAIDPDSPAVQILRDYILARSSAQPPAQPTTPVAEAAPEPIQAAPAALVSKEGYARFEQRAKRRRVDRRLEAARQALAQGQLKQAEAALDEVIELDPNLPELGLLSAQLDELRRTRSGPHAGRWLAAAAAFGAIVLGSPWLHTARVIGARSIVMIADLVPTPVSPGAVLIAAERAEREPAELVAAVGDATPAAAMAEAREVAARMPPLPPAIPPPAAVVPAFVAPPSAAAPPAAPPPAPAPPPPRVAEHSGPVAPIAPAVMPATLAASAADAPAPSAAVVKASASPPAPLKPDDEALVKQILQRYRTAYEGLDARSAHVVWPAVDEGALARAFGGLQSQSLTFESCDVSLSGESAAAICRGSARYVTKVGSREPRTEPRTWNFTLKKDGADWKIQSARAQR